MKPERTRKSSSGRAPRTEEDVRPGVSSFRASVFILLLGLSAAAAFLGRGVRLASVRGELHEVDGRRILPTYHPSAAIRFGPNGAPLAALRADLRTAAGLLTSRS